MCFNANLDNNILTRQTDGQVHCVLNKHRIHGTDVSTYV